MITTYYRRRRNGAAGSDLQRAGGCPARSGSLGQFFISRRRCVSSSCCGFTLLEVILALSILGGAVAVLGELIRNGLLNADYARQLTRAEMLCESIADQVDAGAIAATSVSNTPCDDDPRFLYSINVNQANQTGLLSIEVSVVRDLPEAQHPKKFTLTRWIIDPGVEEQQMSSEQQTATDQAAAAASASGGSSTTSGSPSAAGGS